MRLIQTCLKDAPFIGAAPVASPEQQRPMQDRTGLAGASLGRFWVRSHLGQDDSVLEAKGRDGLALAGSQETEEKPRRLP